MIKRDIQNRDDIMKLMQCFYEKLLKDELMRPVFIDVAKIDLDHHLPILTDFWEYILFQTGSYSGNPMQVHLALDQKTPLTHQHFTTWLRYFEETVYELFEGPKAFLAVTRANSIAAVMQQKIYEKTRSKN